MPNFPNGETRLFPVVGDPIAQVLSPTHMSRLFAERGCNAMVPPVWVGSTDLAETLGVFGRLRNLDGILVTVPHKAAALGLCSHTTDRARFVGSVNVMRKTESGWFGDNTDGRGFVAGIEAAGRPVTDARVLLIGCGGAGAAIALEFLERGAAHLALHDTDLDRRQRVIASLMERYPGRVSIGSTDPTGFNIVANATPMGMRPDDPLPVDAEQLVASQFVACVITKPKNSPLVEAAAAIGCRTMNGYGMFTAQIESLADFLIFPDCPGRAQKDTAG